MKIIKAVIIDDEQSARQTLEELIHKYCKNVHIMGLADGVDPGIELINNTNPDLVFLDIDMPIKDGFELLRQNLGVKFQTIFTTAFNQYALKAIKFSALDYLVKPIDIDELVNSIKKISNYEISTDRLGVLQNYLNNPNGKLNKIILPTPNGYTVEELDDIIRCESDSNYTNFFFRDKRQLVVCRVLREYEELLRDHGFLRVHQSYLINIKHIKKYNKGDSPYVVMADGGMVTIARNKKPEFLSAFFNKLIN
jgi:two-component system LytT family response regulator